MHTHSFNPTHIFVSAFFFLFLLSQTTVSTPAVKGLKHIRVILSIIFLMEACVSAVLGASSPSHAMITERLQIIPSMLAASMGATIIWLIITLLIGRVYCSTVCPLGAIQDAIAAATRKLTGKRKAHRFRPARRIRYGILLLYIVITIAGASAGALLEPWNWFEGFIGAVTPDHDAGIFAQFTANTAFGIVIALAAFAIIAIYAALTGRDFCNQICPIGTALGVIASRSALHIEIEPLRCISCMKCEDGCKASCISVKDRIVDNTRCVRCFNCIAVCPNEAIKLQFNRNSVISPMMRRTTTPSTSN